MSGHTYTHTHRTTTVTLAVHARRGLIMLLCRFVALKDLKTADAPGTVAAIKSALEEDCELTDWNLC